MTAVVRGLLADGLVTDGRGFRALNDEDFLDWITRHGAPAGGGGLRRSSAGSTTSSSPTREDRHAAASARASRVFLTTKMFFEYRGAIFWKMAAGMGDVVFAPLYQALRRRGVTFEFFHRVDHLHLSPTGCAIEP